MSQLTDSSCIRRQPVSICLCTCSSTKGCSYIHSLFSSCLLSTPLVYSIPCTIFHPYSTYSIKEQLHTSSSHSQNRASFFICSSTFVHQLPFASFFSQVMIQVHSVRHVGCSQNKDSLTILYLLILDGHIANRNKNAIFES